MKYSFTLLLFFIVLQSVCSQTQRQIDSVLNLIETTPNDSIKIRLLNQMSFYYIFNDKDVALKTINRGLYEAKKADFAFGLNELTNTKGIYHDVLGVKDSSIFYFSKALEMSQKNGFYNIEVMCLNNLGMYYWKSGQFKEALTYFFDALSLQTEKYPEKDLGRSAYESNIGLIYQELKQYEKAIEYHNKALATREKYNLLSEQSISYANLGICYKSLGDYDLAINTYKKGIALAKEANNLRQYYTLHDNLAGVYQVTGKNELAIANYKKALEAPPSVGKNPKSDLSVYTNIAILYNKIGQPKTALSYTQKGKEILERHPDLLNFNKDLYFAIAESNYMLGNSAEGRRNFERYESIQDSVFSEKNASALAEMEVKFETEQKEKELAQTRATIAENELEIRNKNLLIYGTTALAVILALLGYLIYKQQKLKNQQLQKENQLKEALHHIATQNKLQEQRLQISRDLHDNIGAQLTFIISSLDTIRYAIGKGKINVDEKLKSISHFTSKTIYELRDTIWAMNKTDITFEDLYTRITNYIDVAKQFSINIDFEFVVDNNVDQSYTFSSVEGMHVYRIIQESVNNTLKHAEATQVRIHISEKNQSLFVTITDNGKGFDQNAAELGNGLNNIKKRAKDLNSDLTITSEALKGTTVTIEIQKKQINQNKSA